MTHCNGQSPTCTQAIKVCAAGSTEQIVRERSFETTSADAKHIVPINSSHMCKGVAEDDVLQNGIRRTKSVGGRHELEDCGSM